MSSSFVGFGLGAIQAGLFLYEAQKATLFDRYVICEVDEAVVREVRRAGGTVGVNVAHLDRVEPVVLRNVEVYSPAEDRAAIVAAIGEAAEMATAIPSVTLYGQGGESSVASLLAQGLAGDHPQILYTSENHNRAAEILTGLVETGGGATPAFQALNTVIGKMSGYVGAERDLRALGLLPMVPGGSRALLVEAFDRILVSKIEIPGVSSSFPPFTEKPDLLPFEEAKLYGHNAVHAVLGYLAAGRGHQTMDQTTGDPPLIEAARRCFLEECGPGLIRRHGDLGEELFTPPGWRSYAEDLLERMTNPYLRDPVARVCRDPRRKLGWDDRLVGAMRVVMAAGIAPETLAMGARAALTRMAGQDLGPGRIHDILGDIWGSAGEAGERRACADWIARAPVLREERRTHR
jgi:mannitol-1-phosphate 5-dehydrogenase